MSIDGRMIDAALRRMNAMNPGTVYNLQEMKEIMQQAYEICISIETARQSGENEKIQEYEQKLKKYEDQIKQIQKMLGQ